MLKLMDVQPCMCHLVTDEVTKTQFATYVADFWSALLWHVGSNICMTSMNVCQPESGSAEFTTAHQVQVVVNHFCMNQKCLHDEHNFESADIVLTFKQRGQQLEHSKHELTAC